METLGEASKFDLGPIFGYRSPNDIAVYRVLASGLRPKLHEVNDFERRSKYAT